MPYLRSGIHGTSYIHIGMRGAKKLPPNCWCGFMQEYLCDFPTGNGTTCDAPLCSVCAFDGAIDRRTIDGKEGDLFCFCPNHFNQYLQEPWDPYPHVWHWSKWPRTSWDPKEPGGYKGMRCRLSFQGEGPGPKNALVEFESGERFVVIGKAAEYALKQADPSTEEPPPQLALF